VPPTSSELISALSHPLRRRILSAYVDGVFQWISAQELAEVMDLRVSQVAYHLKMLEKIQILASIEGEHRWRPGEIYGGWILRVEPEWLRLVLEVWAEAEVSP